MKKMIDRNSKDEIMKDVQFYKAVLIYMDQSYKHISVQEKLQAMIKERIEDLEIIIDAKDDQ